MGLETCFTARLLQCLVLSINGDAPFMLVGRINMYTHFDSLFVFTYYRLFSTPLFDMQIMINGDVYCWIALSCTCDWRKLHANRL